MPDSTVILLMRQFKADLLRGERAQSQAMAQAWLSVERRLSSHMDALAYEMDAIARSGGTVSREMLYTNVRYRELLLQLQDELEGYSDYAEVQITQQQRRLARLGIAHGERAIIDQGLRAGFARLPVESVEYLVGLAGDGSPLGQLIRASWPLAAEGLTRELVNGVALGYNPRKTARLMAQGARGSLKRMNVIARTESLRVYRFANLESYKESGVVISYERLATHDNRVCAACLMDEGTEYGLDEMMALHPQDRCTLVPIVEGLKRPQWLKGAAWFVEQPQATQLDILGKGRYYAWQNGDFSLDELVTVKPNATWGDSVQVTPLRELTGV